MNQYVQIDNLKKISTLVIYRLILKNMKFYPSKNRLEILDAVIEEFRDNKNIKGAE